MIYFFSDVHLGVQERRDDVKREDLLLRFLSAIRKDCTTLYIVGDLFDYWFEYKTVTPKYFFRTLTALKDIFDSGIKIEYLMGNHDFGHRDFFREEIGIEVHHNDITRVHDGKKFYLSHGDGKANNDTGYKILKKIMRHKLSIWFFLKLHPNCGIGMASGTSQKSRVYTDAKNFGKTEGMEEFAEKMIREQNFDYVIMGHRHKSVQMNLGNGQYLNLGEWIQQPMFARWDGKEMKLLKVKDLLNE